MNEILLEEVKEVKELKKEIISEAYPPDIQEENKYVAKSHWLIKN